MTIGANDDARFMRMALEQAAAARRAGEVPVGAVVVRATDGEVLGTGFNAPIGGDDPTAHAEIHAIRAAAARLANYRLPGCVLYSTVEPCLMCVGAALHARLERIVFGAPDPKVGATSRLAALAADGAWLNHRIEMTGGVLAGACSDMLVEFFEERRTV